MGIEDIQISEELTTNAPSIKYSGNEGPKSPQQMQEMMIAQLEEEYSKYLDDVMEQGLDPMSFEEFLQQAMAEEQMSGGNPLPQDPTKPVNPFAPKPTGPVLPDRQMAAYGGIMGIDGRKQYGIGSWFQKAKDVGEQYFLGKTAIEIENESQARVDREQGINRPVPIGYDIKNRKIADITPIGDPEGTLGPQEGYFDTLFKGEKDDKGVRQGGLNKEIVPIVGGAIAGLFTKKNNPDGSPGTMSPDETALQLADLKKSANILDQEAGLAANLNFLPAVEARKYTPAQMLQTYQNAANGGRIGFNMGGGADMGAPQMNAAQVQEESITKIMQKMQDPNLTDEDRAFLQAQLQNFMPQKQMPMMGMEQMPMMAMGGRIGFNMGGGIMDNRMGYNDGGSVITLMDGTTVQIPDGAYDNGTFKDIIYSSSKGDLLREDIVRKLSFANGGRIGFEEGGGIMDLGGMEKDYRAEGGFVPIGREEKADDVPARLSVNEFVFTADAVRNAGGGDIDQGAQVMENMMKNLEAGGQVSEESQGMQGARDMFATSERLSEVI